MDPPRVWANVGTFLGEAIAAVLEHVQEGIAVAWQGRDFCTGLEGQLHAELVVGSFTSALTVNCKR